jgi:ATP-dependent Zn protease
MILVMAAYFTFSLFSNAPTMQDVSLSTIVSAIESGQVETLSVRGDDVVAIKFDGTSLSSRKESNISTIEALEILGASPEALRTLPIQVENPAFSFGSLFSLLLTFLPLLFVGFIFFRIFRQMQGGSDMMGRIGRSTHAFCQVPPPKMKREKCRWSHLRMWPERNRPSWNCWKWSNF